MTPGAYNLTMTRGCRFPASGSIVLQLIGGSGPVDLTGMTFEAQVRIQSGDTVILDLDPVVTNAAIGEVSLTSFSDEETSLYEAGVYQWDLIRSDVSNVVTGRYLAGQFYIVNKISES
jgi:hypothetical protein